MTPEWTAGPPSSEMKTCEFSSPTSSSPGSVCSRSAIWFAIVAVGRKMASSCPSSAAARCLQLVDGRILALLLVADDGRGDRGAHRRRVGCVAVSERRSITGEKLP